MAELENEVIAELTEQAQKPVELLTGKRYAWLVNGRVVTEDLTAQEPPFKAGTVGVRDVASFAHYFGKHGHGDSEVFTDLEAGTVTAVIDAHSTDYANWQKHRLILTLVLTKAWLAWTRSNDQPKSQADFAEFLEDHGPDVHSPDAADLREIVRKFQATVETTVVSHQRPESSTITFTYDQNVKALGSRELEIPAQLVLAIKPYDDCDDMTITARLRYHVGSDGEVRWRYVLDRPERIAEQAVKDVVAKVAWAIRDQHSEDPQLDTPRTIMRGIPSQS